MDRPDLENACATPTAEARIIEIMGAARADMITRIREAIEEATRVVSTGLMEQVGDGHAAPPADYHAAVAQQFLFCLICDADPETLECGRADVAAAMIRNYQGLAASWLAASAKDTEIGN